MKMTVEISMYPVRDEYLPPIKHFIAELNQYRELNVDTTPTSTRVTGDYDAVMAMLNATMKTSYERYGTSVFVTKFLPGYVAE